MRSNGHIFTAPKMVTKTANAMGACKTSPKISFRTKVEVPGRLRLLFQRRMEAGTTGGIQDGLINSRTRKPKRNKNVTAKNITTEEPDDDEEESQTLKCYVCYQRNIHDSTACTKREVDVSMK